MAFHSRGVVTFLHRAISKRDAKEVQRLLDDPKVDPNYSRLGQVSPFVFACELGRVDLIKPFLECKRYIDYNITDVYGWGPLSRAFSDPESAKLLLDDSRVDAIFVNKFGSTVLHGNPHRILSVKVLMAHDRFDASLLLSKNRSKETPLEQARLRNEKVLAELYQNYIDDPVGTKAQLRSELGYPCSLAGELFAIVVLLCDNYLELK